MPDAAARDVILYYSHVDTPAVRREVAALRAQLDGRYDIFVIGSCASPAALRGIEAVPVRAYTLAELQALPYPGKMARFRPDDYIGYVDLAPMRFYLEQPRYEHYWIIENDVRYCGEWGTLFEELRTSEADLLCTTVQRRAENPGWAHWHTLGTGEVQVPPERQLKGFIPFGRVSRRLFAACDARYRAGWCGHSEVLWPTIALEAGMRVEDIGGDGNFTPPAWRGRHYYNAAQDWSLFPGTFVYRPCFTEQEICGPSGRFPGWLWHPVKASI
ncbi:MAG: hypothetical protein ABI992_03170 [Chthoniobacterales bacterium]